MSTFILIHGAWQGGWCWEALATLLRQQGHQVFTPDLPGHGKNTYPLAEVTYEMYYKSLEQELLQHTEPVVLVAHSMSGMMAAPLLDNYPEKIAHLYLIAAIVAQEGESLFDVVTKGGPSVIPDILINNPEDKTQSLDPHKVKEAFYYECPSDIADWAIKQLQPQPVAPFSTPIYWKDSGETIHKRTYILCENDRDVHPQTQMNVIDRYPCKIQKISACHFPFLSAPHKLIEIIEQTCR
jgi:pimeloyl-ACP methyl ester carboxylesterase